MAHGLLHREPHRWRNWRQGVLTFPICSCLESILKGTNLASVWIRRDEPGVLSNSLHIVSHYQKKLLPTRCTYVSCGPLVLVVFENPSASLDLSNAIVDKVNAEAPSFALSSWISYLGFRRRAALDSANVNKYQPYKNGLEDDWGANGFFVAPHTDPRCRVRCEPGRNSVETVRYRDVPRRGSCGRICFRHLKPSFYKAELGMVPWYRGVFSKTNYFNQTLQDVFFGNRCSIRLLRNIFHLSSLGL